MAKPKTKEHKALVAAMKTIEKRSQKKLATIPAPKGPARLPTVFVEQLQAGERDAEKRRLSRERREEALNAMDRGRRKNKYGNRKIETPDGLFDSQAEARRWAELGWLAKAGKIFGLKRQVRIPLHVDKEMIGHYVADFVYCQRDVAIVFSPKWGFVRGAIVEDVKGHRTDLYKWKRSHFKAEYGFAITEVKA